MAMAATLCILHSPPRHPEEGRKAISSWLFGASPAKICSD